MIYNSFKIGRRCPDCLYKNEQECRNYLEKRFNCKFSKIRPKWLNRLELDGYNKNLKMAFEYNGEQHYQIHELWHKCEKDLIKQQERDWIKKQVCEALDIKLIIIPFYCKNKEKFIESQLMRTKKNDYL